MRITVLFVLFFLSLTAFSQRNLRDSSVNTLVIGFNYKLNQPGGDFAELWGIHNAIGLDVGNKFKNNFTISVNNAFLFGNTFRKIEIFKSVMNSDNSITSWGGNQAEVSFLLRGWQSHVNAGYVWNKIGNNPNSGLWINGGLGFLLHKIRIESTYDDVPQLEGDYQKGYDRLTYGLSSQQFIGYLFQANKRFLNFYAGLEFVQGFTRNVRTYNFDLGGPDNTKKIDLFYGVKLGWMIPAYKRKPNKIYYD